MTQNVPTTMVAGKEYKISISVKNNGIQDWTSPDYRMGSQNPQDNSYWGGRVNLASKETLKSGQTKTFNFSVKAPAVPGAYDFQWKMLQENKGWFGEQSENVKVTVTPSQEVIKY